MTGLPDPHDDWDEYERLQGLGPQLVEARIGDTVVTLHPSEHNVCAWVARGPHGLRVQGGLDGSWTALQHGREELILGLVPEGTSSAEARIGEDGSVTVHLAPRAYWLVAPLAREILLTFRDAAGTIIWEHRLNAWRHASTLGLRDWADDFRLRMMADYRLGEPLVVLRVAGEDVSIHRQEGTSPNPFGEVGESFGESADTVWGIHSSPDEHGGGGGGRPPSGRPR